MSMRDAFSNWRHSDLPLPRKVFLLMRNNTKKVVTLKDCCGHHGEPGC